MRFFIIIFLNFVLVSFAYAETAMLPEKIQQFYKKTDGFSANFKQILEQKESKSQETRDGKLSFKKPLLIRWQTFKPHDEILVINSKEIWDYLPDEDIAYRYSPALVQDSRSIIRVITGQAKLTSDFDFKMQDSENNIARLLLYPKEPSPQMVEATLWADEDSGQIKRVRVIDFYGNANEIVLSDISINPHFSANEFSFTPPKGIEVEDRIEKKIEERTLFN